MLFRSGDTLWSSCYAAFDRLSPGTQRDLEGLQAIHDLGDFRNALVNRDEPADVQRLNEGVVQFGHCVRPLVGSHPVTGRKYLCFNEAFVTHIVGLTTSESNSLKTFLANHMNTPEDQVRWRWTQGDLAMWDNRVTQHYAVPDYNERRRMHRITIAGDVPV